jgi:hypothetical protein
MPKTKGELFCTLGTLIGNEYLLLPECKGGPGASGRMVEALLGSEGRSHPFANVIGVETKTTAGKCRITLFHKHPDGGVEALRPWLMKYGRVKDGLRSWHHTVSAQQKLVYTKRSETHLIVEDKRDRSFVSWSLDNLTNAASKLKDTVLILTSVRTDSAGLRYVHIREARHLTAFHIREFANVVASYDVIIEFDTHERADSDSLRDRGPKFRLNPNKLDVLWGRIEGHQTIATWAKR